MEGFTELNIHDLRKMFPMSVDDNLADDLFIADLRYVREMSRLMKYPCRFNGYLAFFCYSGHFDIDVNLNTYEVKENSLFLYIPGNIVRVSSILPEEKNEVHFVVIAVSSELIASTRMDFNKIFAEGQRLLTNPCVIMKEKEKELCRKYLDLVKEISEMHLPYNKDAISTLISSTFYLMGSLFMDRLSEARLTNKDRSSRSRIIFEDFLNLVKDFHTEEREISFYSEKMFLTPKYLSKVVKNVSGRSAHDWIDSFVILEAKNLLKFSGLSIKEIVFNLHFPGQASFYRFFRDHTGMTPTEYKKS